MNRTKILLVAACLLLCNLSYAIKPSPTYRYTPDTLNLQYEDLRIDTADGASIHVWHLPGKDSDHPVIISESDAGNMGDWLYLGYYLQFYGVDVWMYDYRGFGSSSAFEVQQPNLFYTEFINDLSAVVNLVMETTGKAPVLFGISMGSIISEAYLRSTDVSVCATIYDGFVCDPYVWKDRLAAIGKNVIIPEDYTSSKAASSKSIPRLFIFAREDKLSRKRDIPRMKGSSTKTATFKCGHIQGFSKFPEQYAQLVTDFIEECE